MKPEYEKKVLGYSIPLVPRAVAHLGVQLDTSRNSYASFFFPALTNSLVEHVAFIELPFEKAT